MTLDMPPPPSAPPVRGRSPRRILRDIGFLVALSAPVSGFFVWIIVALIVGEDQLEGESGQTLLGLSLFVVPVVIGLLIAGWAQFARDEPQLPKLATVAKGSIAVGVLLFAVGLLAAAATDASIGAGLLLIAGVVLCGAGVALYASVRNSR